ncbi:MAG: hypothetical protein MJ208_00585 [Bacilli bacterium]|nr:hypothetical protein [Bacilli bacterium]
MRKNRLFVFLSMLACLLTSCGGSVKHADPVITFDGVGGSLVTGETTTSVKSGTQWGDITKPFFSRNNSVSLFYTLVQDNIAYTVPNTFPVCADLTVFAYYTDTPYLSNQVVIFGDSIIPTTRSFAKDDFSPMTFELFYKEGQPTSKTVPIYDPSQADVTLSEDKMTLTVTPKTNDMITILISDDITQPIVVFDGNGGTVDGEPYATVKVERGTTFGEITTPEPKRGDEKFVCFSFTKDGTQPVSPDYEIIGPTRVYACYEKDIPVAQDNTITVEGTNIDGATAEFANDKFNTIDISYTVHEGYEYSGIEYDKNKATVEVDKEKQIIHVTPKVNDDIDITINTTKKKVTVKFIGNGGKSGGQEEVYISNIDYGSMFGNIKNKPVFYKDGKEQISFAFDDVGKNPISNTYILKDDVTTVYAHYDTLEIGLLDDSMVVYGSTAISYSSPTDITVTSDHDKVVNLTIDKTSKRIIIDSITNNVASSITITVKNGADTETCELSVYHPVTLQQASEAVDFALTRKLSSFDLTFAYSNKQTEDEFYKNSVETRGCISSLGAKNWHTGENQTISFNPVYRNDMGINKVDITTKPKYYYENLKNAAFEMHKANHTNATSLPIDNVEKTLEVHNSEGLFFALEHGFKPIFVGTDALAKNAETIYGLARKACETTYDSEDTEFNNVRYLYDWLVDNTHRDYWIDSADGPSDDKNKYSSYYTDGVFLNKGAATDDGISKAFAMMGGIEGLPIVRATGTANVSGVGSYYHAWNYYRSGGKWYSICPTWSHFDKTKEDDALFGFNFSCNSYQPFMRSKTYFYDDSYNYAYNFLLATGKFDDATAKRMAASGSEQYRYAEGLFSDLDKSNSNYTTNIYDKVTFVFDEKNYSFNIQSDNAAETLVSALPSSLGDDNFTIDLPYSSYSHYNALETALKKKFSGCTISEINNYVNNYDNAELHVLVKKA